MASRSIMTKDEAVSQAQSFVRSKYPIVPPVVMVQHVTVRQVGARHRLQIESWMQFGRSMEIRYSVSLLDLADIQSLDTFAVAGKWLVAFFMNWDTDAAGMPETLQVTVDDVDGIVTQVSPE
jgi:hypothetical protein